MRRKDRQELNPEEIRGVINRCKVIRLGFHAPEGAYIVPMNFGWAFEDGNLVFYTHSAREGRKLDLLAQSARIGFEMDCSHALIEAKDGCSFSFQFESVIGTGVAALIAQPLEKARALEKILLHQTGRAIPVSADETAAVAVLRLVADEFACKRRM